VTPEERAAKCLESFGGIVATHGWMSGAYLEASRVIREQLIAAIIEAREACAKKALAWGDEDHGVEKYEASRRIADAIRAMNSP
jgi:hypothetical protein